MTTRRRLLALVVLLAPIAARAQDLASAPVEAIDQGILAIMHAGRSTSFAQRMQMMTPVVQAAYDLPRILSNSVGLRFAGFPPPAQADAAGRVHPVHGGQLCRQFRRLQR